FDISFFVGEYEIEVNSDNCYPLIGTILFDGNTFSEIDLSPQDIIYDEDWESGIQDWSVNGEWQLIENLEEGGFCITDSWGGNGFYEPNCDWDIVSGAIDLTEDNMLSFDQRIYTEWDFDFVTVEVSSDQTSWDVLYQNSGMFDFWDRVNISLSEYNNQQIYLRFHITADSPNVNLVDPGWMIDDIRIYSGSSSIVENENDSIVPQQQIYLSQNYPNPFNPTTKIPFYISSDFNEANLSIYNILGQEIKSYNISEEDNKKGFLVWEANKNATGVYFYKLTVDNKLTKTKKAILLK
ncbi:MAG: T9SS type A sorting domain-containing protein, partial [Candidatus Cloacimonadota bacterium]|nr:T9SS type A sorting domain-containing protein [Candidatus Cloacimonadota bacterium]